jgi:MFS family permease
LYLIRWGYRLPMLLGLGCWVVTLFILSQGWGSWTIGTLQVGAFWLIALEVALSGIGSGLAAPSSNNASLDLLPQRAALITGIRGMFRSVGGVVGTALIVLVLQFSPDRATGLRLVFGAMAVILVAVMPLTFAIPDSARRRRRELAQRAERIRGSLGAD